MVAAFFGLTGLIIAAVFLRSTPPQLGVGIIVGRRGQGGGSYSQHAVGTNRGFQAPNTIPIGPSVTFEVNIEGVPGLAVCSLNTIAASKFNVGEKVHVTYQIRGLSPIWTKIFITKMDTNPF